jgi:DNA-binding transcriptional LysR family regulator
MKIAPRHIICHGEALRDAAVCGMGIACLPTWLIHDDLRAGRLHQVLDDGAVEGEHIYLLWPHSRPLVPKTRVVVDTLKETFLPTAPWDQPT